MISSSVSSWARQRPTAAFAAALVVALTAFFSDPLLTGRTFRSRDMVPFFLPIERAVHESWRAGRIPLLLPEISFGRPLAANPNTGAFYPLRVAMAALPFRVAWKVFPVLHLWIGGVGAFVLCRFLGGSALGAAASGFLFAFACPAQSEATYYNIVPGYALLPWLIVAAGSASRGASRRGWMIFASLVGVDLLAGDLFTTGLALSGALLLVAGELPGRRRAVFQRFAAASAVGFLLAGIQIVPAAILTPSTIRGLGRFTLANCLFWSVSLWRLIELAIPFPFGNTVESAQVWGGALWSGKTAGFYSTIYLGALPALALISFRAARGRRVFLYGFTGASAFLAIFGFYVPRSLLQRTSPLPLRYPEKFLIGFVLAAVLLAGLALDRWVAGGGDRPARLAAGVSFALLACSIACRWQPARVAAFIDGHWSRPSHQGAIGVPVLSHSLLAGAALWAVAGGLLLLLRRRWMLPAALALLVGDVAWVDSRFRETSPEDALFDPPATARLIHRINLGSAYGFFPLRENILLPGSLRPEGRDVSDDMRWYLHSDAAAAFGIAYVFNNDYDLSDDYRVELARRELTREEGRRPHVDRYLAAFSARSTIGSGSAAWSGFPLPAARLRGDVVWVNRAALPRIRLIHRAREVAGVAEAYGRIHDPDADLVTEAVVETGERRQVELSGGEVRIARDEAGRLDLVTTSASNARVLLPLVWSSSRQASVDDRPATLEPTNLCLSSIAVGPGRHRVKIRERMPGGAAGAAVSLAGVLGLVLLGRQRAA